MAVEKKYITSEDLKKHNKPDDLWISIQGKVYDVSEWVKRHPGGEVAIANVAGQDVTDAFIAYHTGMAWKNLDPLFTGYHLEDYVVSDVSKAYRRLAAKFSKLGLSDKKGHVAVSALAAVAALFLLVHIPVFAVSARLFKSIRSVFYGRNLDFDPVARFLVSYQHWTFYPGTEHSWDFGFLDLVPSFGCLLAELAREVRVRADFLRGDIDPACSVLSQPFPGECVHGSAEGQRLVREADEGEFQLKHGALQFQLKHHLFPRLPRCQLRKVSPLVQDLCKKHNLPYRSYSFVEANVWTIKTLRAVAVQARDLANPMPKNMVWEAVHTHT
ncbi:unnamed protein product [Linum trigynum]|uniref:Cytochrome b5 heme-binding domain-containing protein n=1 Tax=Linum trigynum TaxID=586398 RepID=A0AAV2GAU4_9ROSI